MKYFLLSCLLALTLAQLPTRERRVNPRVPNPDIGVNYDRFKDTTAISASLGYLENTSIRMVVLVVFNGKEITAGHYTISIAIISRSPKWVFLKSSPVLLCILNKTERINLGEMKRISSEVEKDGVSETVVAEIPLSALRHLAKAESVEMQVAEMEFALTKWQISTIDDLRYEFEQRSASKLTDLE